MEITNERYEELIKAEHACEIIRKYVADDTYISTKVIHIVLGIDEKGIDEKEVE